MKLPIFASVGETYRLIFRHAGFLVRVGWPWAILMVGGFMAIDALGLVPDSGTLLAQSFGWLVATFGRDLVRGLVLAAVAVPWHRRVLGVEQIEDKVDYFRVALRYGLIAFAIDAAITLGFHGLDWISTAPDKWIVVLYCIWFACLMALFYITARFALVLPAIAIKQDDTSLSAAWHRTTGNGWRLVAAQSVVVGLIVVPIHFLNILSQFYATALPAMPHWAESLSFDVPLLASVLAGISFLSVAYRRLVLERSS